MRRETDAKSSITSDIYAVSSHSYDLNIPTRNSRTTLTDFRRYSRFFSASLSLFLFLYLFLSPARTTLDLRRNRSVDLSPEKSRAAVAVREKRASANGKPIMRWHSSCPGDTSIPRGLPCREYLPRRHNPPPYPATEDTERIERIMQLSHP